MKINKSILNKMLSVYIILMMIIPSVIAAPADKDLKITDYSKNPMVDISSGIKSSSGDIIVEEKNKNSIKLKDSKPSKNAKEHKKVKVSIPASELQKIDADNDGVFGVLEIADDGTVIGQRTATTAQLVEGDYFTFSDVEINGFSGYREKTFTGVKSGDILDTVDVFGNYTITATVNGTIPAYVPIEETNISTYPASVVDVFPMNANGNSLSGITGTQTNVSFASGKYAAYNGIDSISSYVTGLSGLSISSNQSIHAKTKVNAYGTAIRWIVGKYGGGTPGAGYVLGVDASGKLRWEIRTDNLSAFSYTYTAQSRLLSDAKVHDIVTTTDTVNRISRTYIDGKLLSTMPYTGNITSTTPLKFGSTGTGYTNQDLYTVGYYNSVLSAGEVAAITGNGYGIGLDALGENTWVPYNVTTGTEKIIASGGTSTQVNYVDSSLATRTVTIRTYYTEDTTKITQSVIDGFYSNGIWHPSTLYTQIEYIPSVEMTTGTITDDYTLPVNSTPSISDVTSNDNSAAVSINSTHIIITTSNLVAGQTYTYDVYTTFSYDSYTDEPDAFYRTSKKLSSDINSAFVLGGTLFVVCIAVAMLMLLAGTFTGNIDYKVAIVAVTSMLIGEIILVLGLVIISGMFRGLT